MPSTQSGRRIFRCLTEAHGPLHPPLVAHTHPLWTAPGTDSTSRSPSTPVRCFPLQKTLLHSSYCLLTSPYFLLSISNSLRTGAISSLGLLTSFLCLWCFVASDWTCLYLHLLRSQRAYLIWKLAVIPSSNTVFLRLLCSHLLNMLENFLVPASMSQSLILSSGI